MRAARFHGPRDIRVEEVATPTIKPGHVLVDVEWCGICGTDLHEYLHGPALIPPKDRPHPLTGEHVPIIMGHEFCGRIRQLPDGYEGALAIGCPVMVDPRIVCGTCAACKDMSTNFCSTIGYLGLNGEGGGLSETVAVACEMCYALPSDADLSLAALIEPLSVARHAMRMSGLADLRGCKVLILGGGPIGHALAMILKEEGAHQVIVSEPTDLRRKQIQHLASFVIDPKGQDVATECQKLTGGSGVDLVFDCAGVTPAMRAAFDALKIRGTYVNIAMGWSSEPSIPLLAFMLKEITIKGTVTYDNEDFAAVVRDFCAAKYPNLASMVTARVGLEDVVDGAFEQLLRYKDDHIKILVTPKSELA